ncbi:MAG TPA: DNA translocase FtsK 4TM domain-containing protein, partial [Rhabdaerophilum sp.]|nr:DNA translocase FtsK 4TM domain-containing protein [Rhabdaerophilum sp.]
MRTTRLTHSSLDVLPQNVREGLSRRMNDLIGLALIGTALALGLAFASWSVGDPSLSHATSGKARNLLSYPGAILADLGMQLFGIGCIALVVSLAIIGARMLWIKQEAGWKYRAVLAVLGLVAASGFASALPQAERWPLPTGFGGAFGDALLGISAFVGLGSVGFGRLLAGGLFGILTLLSFSLLMRGLSPATTVIDDERIAAVASPVSG